MSSLKDVDLVLNAGDLSKILHYMSDPLHSVVDRFDLEWQDGKLYMVGWEADPRRDAPFDLKVGFLSYASFYPQGLEDSFSHHRVLTYDIGGLKCLVTTDADAYWYNRHCPPGGPNSNPAAGNEPETVLDGFHSSSSRAGNGVGSVRETASPPGALMIRCLGQEIPWSCLMLVSLRGPSKRPRFESRAYFSRIFHLYDGIIRDEDWVDKVSMNNSRNIEGKLANWERENQANIRRMVDFLKMLIQRVGISSASRFTLVLECKPEEQEKVKAEL
ncbi:hypothetical protein PG984_002200 [Apiospora sp. TS-2023a]